MPRVPCFGRPRRRMSTPAARALLAALVAAVLGFQVWTVHSNGDPWRFGQEQNDHYNLLLDGWLDGQLHLKVVPHPELLRSPDPYDPAQRPPGVTLHDASWFQGKYYLYFGAAPAVTLLLPFRLATGTDLPLSAAILAFVAAGFLVSVALLLDVRRRYFPEAGPGAFALTVPVLGLASLGPLLLRRPQVWELPIAAGTCYALLALYGVWRSLHAGSTEETGAGTARRNRRRVGWFAAAGLSLGLAIASRPIYLLAGPMLAVPLLYWWRRERCLPWRPLGSALLPLLVIGAAMAWHNHARFGRPWQFGQDYQLSHTYESRNAHFRLTHAPHNLWRYFLAPAEVSPAFPFIHPAPLPPKPPGFGEQLYVHALLPNLPFFGFALALPLVLWRRQPAERVRLATAGLTALALAGALTGTLTLFFGSVGRYQSEFAALLIPLAAVGWLGLQRGLASGWPRGGPLVAAVVGTTAALWTIGFAVLYSLAVDHVFADRNPEGWRALARRLNTVPAAWEALRGLERGPLKLRLEVAAAPPGTRTLVAECGRPPAVERLWLVHEAAGRLTAEIQSAHGRAVRTGPLAWAPGRTHTLELATAALLPPGDYPAWATLTVAETTAALRQLRLRWDDAVALEVSPWFGGVEGAGPVRWAGAAGAPVQMRAAEPDPAAMVAVRAEAATAAREAARRLSPTAAVTLRLTLPAEAAAGTREPLLVTGRPGAGDLIGIEYRGDGTVRFCFDHWGQPSRFSAPVPWPAGLARTVRIIAEPLRAPRPGGRRQLLPPSELRIEWEGREIWREQVDFYAAEPVEVAAAVNPIGGTTCGPAFSGQVHAIHWGAESER